MLLHRFSSTPMFHFLSSIPSINETARSDKWLKLVHYKSSFPFRKHKSQLDGESFFFSPVGKYNPEAELKATVEAFSKDLKIGKRKQHPQCAFPARYRFLKKTLGLKLTDVACPQFDEFFKMLDPESVTLVFSTAYPNNPASMFGHVFLKISSKKSKSEKRKRAGSP